MTQISHDVAFLLIGHLDALATVYSERSDKAALIDEKDLWGNRSLEIQELLSGFADNCEEDFTKHNTTLEKIILEHRAAMQHPYDTNE